MQEKNHKISKSYTFNTSSARQQTSAQYQAINSSKKNMDLEPCCCKKNFKISKSYILGFSSARQQTLAQYQALNLSQRL